MVWGGFLGGLGWIFELILGDFWGNFGGFWGNFRGFLGDFCGDLGWFFWGIFM